MSLFLLIIIATISCEKRENSQIVKIQLYDKLQNDDLIEVITYDMLDYSENILFSESISSLKDKSIEFNQTKSVFATMKIGESYHQVYLEPGFDMKTYLYSNNGQSYLSYSGPGSEANNYLAQSSQIFNEFYNIHSNWFRMNLNVFSNELDSLQKDLIELSNSYLDSVDLIEETFDALKVKNELTLINLRQQHRLINSDAYSTENIPYSLMSSLEDIPFDANYLKLLLLDYAQVLDLFLRSEIQEPIYNVQNVNELDSIKDFFPITTNELIEARDFSAKISEFLRAKNISFWLASEGLSEGVETIYNEFRNDFENSDYKEQLEKKYNAWLTIGRGQPAPDITGLTLDSDTISLSDLKGKVVYIDVWATWCVPCVKEFPHYKKLEVELKGKKEVEFLFLSIDDESEHWVSFLGEKPSPDGIHVRQQLGFGHPSVQESYKMWGVPRYILIDQNGKIVDSNAPRPSSGKVSKIINSL